MIAAADRTSGGDVGLQSLEVRTAPDPAIAELMVWPEALAEACTSVEAASSPLSQAARRDIAPGVVAVGGAGTHADPGAPENAGRCRYSGQFTQQAQSATVLARMLLRWPHTQFSVRALDVCNDELAVPAWVLRPLLALVRKAAQEGARATNQVGLSPPPQQEGDRIGHGLALGMEPALWAARTGRAALPRQDRVIAHLGVPSWCSLIWPHTEPSVLEDSPALPVC